MRTFHFLLILAILIFSTEVCVAQTAWQARARECVKAIDIEIALAESSSSAEFDFSNINNRLSVIADNTHLDSALSMIANHYIDFTRSNIQRYFCYRGDCGFPLPSLASYNTAKELLLAALSDPKYSLDASSAKSATVNNFIFRELYEKPQDIDLGLAFRLTNTGFRKGSRRDLKAGLRLMGKPAVYPFWTRKRTIRLDYQEALDSLTR